MFRSRNTALVDAPHAEPFLYWLSDDDPQGASAEIVRSARNFKPTDRLQDEVLTQLHGERRRRRRYSLALDLTFRVIQHGYVCQTGLGRTINASSIGIAFETENPPPPGSSIELSLAWPMLLNRSCPLQLLIAGKVMRNGPGMAAVRLRHYEFRTRRQNSVRAMAAGLPMV